MPKLKDRFKKGLSVGSALGVVLSGVFLSPLAPVYSANAETVGSGLCTQTVDSTQSVTVIREGDDCLVAFEAVGSNAWTAPAGVTEVRYLIVGGGGGGGSRVGGGGGAGGLLTNADAELQTVIPGNPYPIVVGDGGAGAVAGADAIGSKGDDSSAFGLTAFGGGAGSSTNSPGDGQNGGSGGGSRGNNDQPGGTGVAGQGFEGGISNDIGGDQSKMRGGGGGGASGAGSIGGEFSGNGGDGKDLSDTFTVQFGDEGKFAGGGGGGDQTSRAQSSGGLGGGGNGGTSSNISTAGIDGTGGGGGAGGNRESTNYAGKAGGSGVVIVKYALTAPAQVTGLEFTSTRYADIDSDSDPITLEWSAPSANPAVTSYTIEHSTDPTFATSETTAGITTTSNAFSLADGDTYYFRVKAINDIGEGPVSEVIASRAVSKEDFALANNSNVVVSAEGTEVIPPLNNQDFTVEFWFNASSSANSILLSQGDGSTTYYVKLGGGELVVHFDGVEINTGYAITLNTWTHFAHTIDADDTTAGSEVYIDGNLIHQSSGTRSAYQLDAGEHGLHIGSLSRSDGEQFSGLLDQVKIWDAALIGTQVEQSMHSWGATQITSAPKLIAHYDFNDNTQSSVIRDMAGHHDLQVSGSPTSVPLVEPDTTSKPDSVLYEFTRSYLTSERGWTPPNGLVEVDALVVGGGGGGSGNSSIGYEASGGAGGGGGVYPASGLPLSGVVEVTVGQGGGGGESVEGARAGASGNPGQTSSLEGLTAGGGGGGGCEAYPGQDNVACGDPATIHGLDGNAAGSGGSPSNFFNAYNFGKPGTATSATINGKSFPTITAHRGGYFNDGGSSTAGSSGSAGGAGGAGDYIAPGAGVSSSIKGSAITYGGGGYGWHDVEGVDNGWSSYSPASNTGFGGKGAFSNSASKGFDGSSGVIILAYEVAVANVSISGNNSAFTTETVTLTADTTGSQGNLTYTWERKRSGESDWTTIANSGSSYTTPALTLADDQSQYRVTVDSAINGTSDEDTSNVITLSVSDIVQHYLVFDVDATDLASFDPRTPGVVNDRSATVTTGSTLVGTTQTDSGLFEFDGSGDYVDIGDFPDIDFSEGITIDFVADFGTSADSYERIFDFGNGENQETIAVVRHEGQPNLRYYVIGQDGQQVSHNFNNAISDGSARYTLFAEDQSISLYREGTLIETHTITNGTFLPKTAVRSSNYIAKSNWDGDADFEGTIEYLRLFNYTFDASSLDIIDPDFKTVSFNSQGGDAVNPKKTSGSMLLPATPRPGYNFDGWYRNDTKVGDPGNVYAPSSDLTLDAEWVIDPDRLLIDFDATDTNSFDRSDQSISQRNGDYSGTVSGDLTDGDLDRANFDIGDNVSLNTIPASVNWSDGLTLDFTADFGSANAWERIIDLGTGGFSNQLVFGRLSTTNDMMLEIWGASLSHKVKFEDVLTDSGEHRYTLLYDGTNATLVIDGDAINAITGVDGEGNGGATLPANVERDTNYLGFASRSDTSSGKFDGTLRELKLYNAAYTTDDLSALETTFTTVNFRSENGDFSLETSGSMRLPDPGVNSGKVFDGWHSDSELSNKIGDIGAVHTPGDTELFAKWISDFTLKLYSEGAVIDTQTITSGSSAVDPQINRTGYTLLGWDTDPSADNVVYQDDLVNFSMPPNDVDLYAVWAADDFTATFINNSSTFTTATFDVETALTDPGNPSSVGDRFLGWSTVSDDPASIVSFPYQPTAGNLDLYAVYAVDYAASFDGDDQDTFSSGEGVISGASSFSWEAWIYPTGFNSDFATILENGDTDDNYGRTWMQIRDPDSTVSPTVAEIGLGYFGTDQQGTSLTTNADVIKMNTWQHVAATYEISGGNITLTAYVNGVKVGNSNTVPLTGFLSSAALRIGESSDVNSSQEFEGQIDQVKIWNGDVLNEAQVAESMESIDSITGINPSSYYNFDELGSTITTGDIVEDQAGSYDLTANGTMSRHLNDYSVTYDANGGTGAPADTNLYSPFTSATVLAPGSIEQTNFSFTGWNTLADGAGDPYVATDNLSMLYGDVTLYAQWDRDTFTVTINRGNFAGTSDITLTKTAGVDLTLPGDTQANNTFTREGHVVAGWSNVPQGDSKAYDFGDAYVDDQPATLYPFWVKNSYDLDFVVDGVTTTQQIEFDTSPVFAGSVPTGYTITGWSDGTTTYLANLSDFVMPANTVSLTATLVADVNTITFEANNGSGETTTQPITTDVQTALDTNSFDFDGYAFAGWVDKNDSNNTYDNQELVTFNSDVTLQAVWTAETYDVVFVYNGADNNASPTSTTYTTGQTTDLTLPDPGKAGHSFAGWYSDPELTAFEGNANAVFTTIANVTLYAKWTATPRSVVYLPIAVINGQNVTAAGTVPVDNESYVIGESVPVAANSGSTGDPLSVNHYSFVGWTDQADGSGELLQPGESFIMGDGNVTLYAKWEPITYTINYLANGAAGTPSRTSDTRTVENAVIDPLPTVGDMVKVGHELAGWATDPDAPPAEVVDFISVDKNANYYAIWELKTINYSFSAGVANGTNLDSGTLTGFPNSGSADYGTTITIPTTLQSTLDLDSNSIVDNYLTGWSYDGKVYQPGESFILGEQDPVFVAVWAPLRQVRYSTNGGTHTDPAGEFDELCVMEDNTCTVGLEITLHDEPTRAGYNFLHWEDQKGGTHYAGDVFIVQDDNYLLFAKWEAIQYTFAFANSFKVPNEPNKTSTIGQTITLPEAIDRTGYSFGGWENGDIVYGEQTDFIVGTEGLLFTAIWIPDVYTITFDWQGGTGTASPTATYTVGTGPMNLPTTGNSKDGFVFGGWSETRDGPAVSDYEPIESRVLYAVWDSGFYETTFDAFGGTVAKTVVQVPESTGITLPLPVRPSFTFTGWVDDNDNLVGTDGDTYTPAVNETLTATWVQDSRAGVNPANLSDLYDTTLSPTGAIGTEFSDNGITVKIEIPVEAFSQEVAIDMDRFTNNDMQESLLGTENSYVLSVLLSWISGTGRDATVPDTHPDHPIVMTLEDPDIKAGARIYKVIGTKVDDFGVATQDGEITVEIFEDPSIVVAATKPDQVVISSVSAGDEEATISWSAPSNGGSEITSYTVSSNLGDSCTVVATTCTITGLTNGVSYTFTVTATNSVGTSDPSAESTTVIPSFVTYPVVFDSNGGSHVANTTYPRLGSISKPADPELLGYTFGGWSTVLDDESSLIDFTGGSYDPSVDEAKTFYALWSADDNTVTFKANFEGEDDVTQVITTDVETALTKNSFDRSGYRFLGWAETETGEVVYEDGELVTIQEPKTLWAVWSGNSSPAEETFEAEEVITKPDYSESGGARPGETIEFGMAGGQRVISASVADIEVEFRETSSGFEITVPESLSPGVYDLVVNIDGEEVVYQDYVVILASVIPDTRFWTKRISNTEAKVYIKHVRLGEKYSIGHQTGGSGEYAPVTTITANNFEDGRLRFAIGAYYIVRTITLEPGINRINVYVNGEQQELRGRMDPVRYTR